MKPEMIVALREALGWSQTDLGDALGVARSSVARWELGKAKPSRLALRQLERLKKKVMQ